MAIRECVILTGPTAVGKTAVSLEIARALKGEIINGDMGQCYAPLSIGTAKPAWRESDVPHHFFDTITEPRDCSVVEYRQHIEKIAQEISDRGNIPIIVGGSGFYIRSLFFPIEQQAVPALDYSKHATAELFAQLQMIDPVRAAALHYNDRYRIMRALDVWKATGEAPSAHKPRYKPLAQNMFTIFLSRDREELRARVYERTQEMLSSGWMQEVAQLSPAWRRFVSNKKLIGYPEIVAFLASGSTEGAREALMCLIAQKTAQYAKRQRTFNRMLARELSLNGSAGEEIDLTLLDLNLYIKQLRTRFKR